MNRKDIVDMIDESELSDGAAMTVLAAFDKHGANAAMVELGNAIRDENKPQCECCDRGGEYNGFGSDLPLAFKCPKSCPCHD